MIVENRPMENPAPTPKPESPEVLRKIYLHFRDYFDRAERKRRWNIQNDIPWHQCNPNLNPAIADVVETFTAVELYLPDYLSKLIPQVRANRGRAWMLANWAGWSHAGRRKYFGAWGGVLHWPDFCISRRAGF